MFFLICLFSSLFRRILQPNPSKALFRLRLPAPSHLKNQNIPRHIFQTSQDKIVFQYRPKFFAASIIIALITLLGSFTLAALND